LATVAVVGGAGRMGHWFAKFLKSNGYRVIISDQNRRTGKACSRRLAVEFVDDYLVAAKRANIVLLATPTNVTSPILKQLGRELNKRTLIVEISSVKSPVRRTIAALQEDGVPVLSIHPMFGPGAKSLEGRSILIVSRTRHAEAKRLLSKLRGQGARMVPCSIDKHDTLASIVIALPHLMSISLIETLRSLEISLSEVNMASGTTFRLQSLIAEAIYQEDHANEISILVNSKRSVLRAYSQQVRVLLEIIRTHPEYVPSILSAGRRLVEKDKHFADSYGRFNAAVQAALV
jgi:prephenate dehydrogenase